MRFSKIISVLSLKMKDRVRMKREKTIARTNESCKKKMQRDMPR